MTTQDPTERPELGDPLREALETLASTERLLVALDFDGTLAPEVDDPDAARALPAAHAAVERLAVLPGTRVALVSGRSVDDLERVSRFGDEVLLVGSHGIELRLDDPDDVIALNEKERESMAVLEQVLEQVADSLDQVWLEPKPAGYALHTRLATNRRSRVAHLVARSEAQAEVDDLKVRMGKNVIEFSVRSTTKGEAVEHLRRYTNATAVFYAGDDVTDEDAFAALGPGDLGVKSGTGETAAAHRVRGPREVAAVLQELARVRAARP
ncbi:trehalose-phosphatase [Amnibacterium sp.]|uniref:trehalose-phosphatase n=1 Tax=Amnibacterium sp. TaxID=1872496 RepID=UPI002601FC63|nr:trehalose-phosphatase [Amnibacterium sp.]MCU1473076.1 otsB [Amnibacterium sp.]